jgi:ADP-heptose:LPS heptosyltransferase
MGNTLVRSWGGGSNAAGQFSVAETAALLTLCDEYIGLDTGTTHLAAAVGRPSFAIYGEKNNPGHWFPLGDGHSVLWHRVECAGCRAFECPVSGHPCISGITVEAVWSQYQNYVTQMMTGQAGELNLVEV